MRRISSTLNHDKLIIRAQQGWDNDIYINDVIAEGRSVVREQFLKAIANYPNQSADAFEKSFLLLREDCPFCKWGLITSRQSAREEDGYIDYMGFLEHCTNCLYWRWHFLETVYIERGGGHFLHEYTSYLSKIREFEKQLPEENSIELAQWFRRHPHQWNSIDPYHLERLVADIFKANYGNAEVIHVGKPDDGGVDILFVDTKQKQWLIQVKRRANPDGSEGVGTIRNLLGAMVLEKATYGMVVSTADHFTYRAYEATGRAAECGMTVKLIDRGKLNRMLKPMLPDYPWLSAVCSSYPDFVEAVKKDIPSKWVQLRLFET